jgi:NADH-quinone oxidoreductase subunit J
MLPNLMFYFLAGVIIISATYTAFTNHLVHAAFSLLVTFFGLAGLYLYLAADFVGLTQVLIYVGGILVLFLFGIMLTHHPEGGPWESTRQWWLGLITLAGLGALMIPAVYQTPWPIVADLADKTVESTISPIAVDLLTKYLVPFEVASLLLLVALIGAVVIARGEPRAQQSSRE